MAQFRHSHIYYRFSLQKKVFKSWEVAIIAIVTIVTIVAIIVTDLISGLVEILRLEAEELRDAARQAFAPVELWDKG